MGRITKEPYAGDAQSGCRRPSARYRRAVSRRTLLAYPPYSGHSRAPDRRQPPHVRTRIVVAAASVIVVAGAQFLLAADILG